MAQKAFRTALVFLAGTAALSGCSQLGSLADGVWGGTKTFAGWVASPVTSLLRDAPEAEVEFASADTVNVDEGAAHSASNPSPYAGGTVELFSDPTYSATTPSPYAGDTVELFSQPTFTTAPQTVSSRTGYYGTDDPVVTTTAMPTAIPSRTTTRSTGATSVQSIEFVRLDGQSPSMTDWSNCEVTSGGYWRVDAGGGSVNPQFEVCMRNKNYVLKAERASYAAAQDVSKAGGYTPLP